MKPKPKVDYTQSKNETSLNETQVITPNEYQGNNIPSKTEPPEYNLAQR